MIHHISKVYIATWLPGYNILREENYVHQDQFGTRNHSSRMRTARLPTVPILVAATRCRYRWKDRYTYSLQGYLSPQKGPDTRDTFAPRPHPRGQTDACENITFPQLRWRAVKKRFLYFSGLSPFDLVLFLHVAPSKF